MGKLQAGDWVRTKDGDIAKVVLISRLSAFLDYGPISKGGPASCLLSELTKTDPPQENSFPATRR